MHGGQSLALRFSQGCCIESTEQNMHSFVENGELSPSAAINEMESIDVSIHNDNVHW